MDSREGPCNDRCSRGFCCGKSVFHKRAPLFGSDRSDVAVWGPLFERRFRRRSLRFCSRKAPAGPASPKETRPNRNRSNSRIKTGFFGNRQRYSDSRRFPPRLTSRRSAPRVSYPFQALPNPVISLIPGRGRPIFQPGIVAKRRWGPAAGKGGDHVTGPPVTTTNRRRTDTASPSRTAGRPYGDSTAPRSRRAGEMDEPAVTLIVKAPNQQVEDETVRCGRSWTVGALKRHLSEVYPGRPAPHDQKLIYSGQLLGDSAVLGEVLRRYEGHDTHTVHLVCAPQPGGAPRQGPAGVATAAAPAGGAPGVPPDVCAQYLLMQQAYFQYMTHYMNLYASAANQTPPGTTPNPPGPPPPQPPADPDAAPQRRNDAVAAPPAEPEEERELLDVAYTVGRIVLFSAIMYYYSSPLRYLFVLFLGVCLYVYRMGLFRAAAAAANNNNVAPAAGAADEPAAPTRLAVAWTFFTAFFASLIPEIPNVV